MSASVTAAASVRGRQQFIAGRWVDAVSGRTFEDLNPFSGEVISLVPAGARDDAALAVTAAAEASRVGRVLRQNKDSTCSCGRQTPSSGAPLRSPSCLRSRQGADAPSRGSG
jgi:hypothetical protein